jgi:hypothetical protein
MKSDSYSYPCYYYNNECVDNCTDINVHIDNSDSEIKKCLDNSCEDRVSVNQSCKMPTDTPSNTCYYSDGICLLSCSGDMEENLELTTPTCVRKTDMTEMKVRTARMIVNIVLIVCAIALVIIISGLIALILYYRKKSEGETLTSGDGMEILHSNDNVAKQSEQEMEIINHGISFFFV